MQRVQFLRQLAKFLRFIQQSLFLSERPRVGLIIFLEGIKEINIQESLYGISGSLHERKV